MSEGHRKLATIETIESIRPIPNADAIECARVRGWDVVTKKGEFQPGDKCIYFEIDTMLDTSLPEFAFLAAHNVRTDANGRRGHVLRTMKLRGQVSQGLVLPLTIYGNLTHALDVGTDLTDSITMGLYEPPIPANLSGKVRGYRPSWINKTDEERIQNIPEILTHSDLNWVATEKVDGASATMYFDGETFGCCSRNLDLIETPENTIWKLARQFDVEEKLRAIVEPARATYPSIRVAIQGEVFGEGIRGNPLKMKGHHFAAFNYIIWDRDIEREGWPEWLREMSVPVLDLPFPATLEEALDQASKLRSRYRDTAAEGIVWSCKGSVNLVTGNSINPSFKVISNNYLIKHGE